MISEDIMKPKVKYSKLLTYCTHNCDVAHSGDANDHVIKSFFQEIFPNFKSESEAQGADGWIPNQIVFEFKSKTNDWYSGFFQALSYELSFQLVVVVTYNFIAVWNKDDIDPEILNEISTRTETPSLRGPILAKKLKAQKESTLNLSIWNTENIQSIFTPIHDYYTEPFDQFIQILKKGQFCKTKITLNNFTKHIKDIKEFFLKTEESKLKCIRAFYTMLPLWEENSIFTLSSNIDTQATITYKDRSETIIDLNPAFRQKFIDYVKNHYIYLNEDEKYDDFYTKFDKAIDVVDPQFRIQHGIYFTDKSLAEFALWCVKQHIPHLGEEYLVIDPACGSGNLVNSWREPLQLRHKVISEIEPELLHTVEKRMELDGYHQGRITAIPKETNKGLNFIDKSAESYFEFITEAIKGQDSCEKPIAFLCNPPYRNDDDKNKANRVTTKIDSKIIEMIGEDASSERMCCFLAQMKRICEWVETGTRKDDSFLLLFTPTNWLNNTPVYKKIRQEILNDFEDKFGFIVNSKEFFDVPGKFPIAFTIWQYVGKNSNLDYNRPIILHDLTSIKKQFLIDTFKQSDETDKIFKKRLDQSIKVPFGLEYQTIIQWLNIPMTDFKRDRRANEKNNQINSGGLPLNCSMRKNKKNYGESNGDRIGFMDDLTPCQTHSVSYSVFPCCTTE